MTTSLPERMTGIPPLHYGQDYYTLRSIFFDGVAPPVIHMHLRLFNVATDVPIGDLPATQPTPTRVLNGSANDDVVEVDDIPPQEKAIFDEWLHSLWQEKDEFITKNLSSGHTSDKFIEIPLRLLRKREHLDAFCFFIPAVAGYAWSWATKRVWKFAT